MHNNVFLVEDDIDDQLFVIEAIKKIISNVKYTVAHDGRDALVKLKMLKHLPGLIFLDINMPLMNGFEFLKHLKAEKPYDKIPVIVLSTLTNIAEQAYRLGAIACITKPASFHELKSEIESVFNKLESKLNVNYP